MAVVITEMILMARVGGSSTTSMVVDGVNKVKILQKLVIRLLSGQPTTPSIMGKHRLPLRRVLLLAETPQQITHNNG